MLENAREFQLAVVGGVAQVYLALRVAYVVALTLNLDVIHRRIIFGFKEEKLFIDGNGSFLNKECGQQDSQKQR